VRRKMANKEASDRAFENLKIVAKNLVWGIEKDCSVKLGRDKIEKDSHLNRIAGITYGTLIEEVKAAFKQDSRDRMKNVERW